MQTIYETTTFILEVTFTHDQARDIHTLDLYQTWPSMAKPHRRRVVQLNLPRTALMRLARAISENADGSA